MVQVNMHRDYIITTFTFHVIKLSWLLNSLAFLDTDLLLCCRESQITDSAEYMHINTPICCWVTKIYPLRTYSALPTLFFCWSPAVKPVQTTSPQTSCEPVTQNLQLLNKHFSNAFTLFITFHSNYCGYHTKITGFCSNKPNFAHSHHR